jgi:hypothetical protein
VRAAAAGGPGAAGAVASRAYQEAADAAAYPVAVDAAAYPVAAGAARFRVYPVAAGAVRFRVYPVAAGAVRSLVVDAVRSLVVEPVAMRAPRTAEPTPETERNSLWLRASASSRAAGDRVHHSFKRRRRLLAPAGRVAALEQFVCDRRAQLARQDQSLARPGLQYE